MAGFSSDTFVHAFLRHVEASPDTIAIRYLHEGDLDGPTTIWTYAELGRRAKTIAANLARANIHPGDRALLSYTECLGFTEAFLGCMLAGVIPIPVAAPESSKMDRALARMRNIATVSGAQTILTSPSLADRSALDRLSVLATSGDATLRGDWGLPDRKSTDIAFVQFTSGSTSDPKGVIVSHANLAANQRIVSEGMSIGPTSTFVNWLPVHHDMGLIGNLLLALWNGRPITCMLPQHFMERPARWLEAISGQTAVFSGGPNFAFAIANRKLSDEVVRRLDLSGWQTAFCGAEPIRYDVLRRFAQRLAPQGLRPEALFPCYGLAEATVYASGGRPWLGPLEEIAERDTVVDGFVCCGRPGSQIDLAIVNPITGERCKEDVEGEVWLRGPNIAAGYWGDPELTTQIFGAKLAGAVDGAAWLRTGDLGRMRAGALYITGRVKDLIIVNGRNIYPQDVELAIDDCHADVRPGCAAAFAVEGDGSEGVGVAFEVRERESANQAMIESACAAVARSLDVQLSMVALLPPRALLKTTSGKPQRQAMRAVVEGGGPVALLLWRAPRQARGASMAQADIIAAIAGWISTYSGRMFSQDVDRAGLDELGLDSIARAELLDWIRTTFDRALTMDQLLAQPNLAAIAALVQGEPGPERPAAPRAADTEDTPVLPSLSWLQET